MFPASNSNAKLCSGATREEANETDYWLSLLKDSNLLTVDIYI